MKEFEKDLNEVEKDRNYELEMENCIEFLKGSKVASVTFTQGRYISKIEKLAIKFPDEVKIVHRNYNQDGNVSSILAHIPTRYIQLSNRKRDLSEEEKQILRDRLIKNVYNTDSNVKI